MLRGLIVGVLFFFPPQEESFVQQLNQAIWDTKPFHFKTKFGPSNRILLLFYLADNVFSFRDWTGVFHLTEILAQPWCKAEHEDSYLDILQWVNTSKNCLGFLYITAPALSLPLFGTYCISDSLKKVTPPASGWHVLVVSISGGFFGIQLCNTDVFFSDVLESPWGLLIATVETWCLFWD